MIKHPKPTSSTSKAAFEMAVFHALSILVSMSSLETQGWVLGHPNNPHPLHLVNVQST